MTDAPEQRPPVQKQFEIKNRLGLHARAAALFVQTIAGFNAEIMVAKDGQDVNGKSILGLMMLAAGQGSLIEVSVTGPDADAAIEAIESLIEARFREDS